MTRKLICLVMVIVLLIGFSSLVQADESTQENLEEKDETKTEEKIEKKTERFKTIDTGIDPLLVIDDIEVDEEVAVGKEFYIKFIIRNMGTGTAMMPTIEFEEQDENNTLPHFEVVNSGGNTFNPDIREIKSTAVRSMTVKMKVKDTTPERSSGYKLNVKLKCQNANLKEYFETNTNITIFPKYALTEPVFVVKSVQFDPKEPDLTKPFTATVIFENISETDAHNVSVALDGSIDESTKNFTILDLSNTKHIFDVKGKQTRLVTFKLEAEEPRDGNEIKIKFNYEYEGKTKTQEEIINLPLSTDDIGASGKVPWVIINKYTLSDEQVLAGNKVMLKLYVENTNSKDVYNAKVSIVDIQLEDDKKGDTVFSPVDSSNTFYIEKIPGRTTVAKEIVLYVDPNAQAKTYNVPIEIKYEYDNGQQNTVNERVNIPVTQECKFNVLSVNIPSTAMVGQPVQVASEFVNVGKVDLTNFMVNMEGEFPKEDAVYYVGNLETGMSDFYQAMIFPEAPGEIEGKIVFTYTDNNNKEVREEKPFTITVEEMPKPDPNEGPIGPEIEGKPGMGRPPMGPDGSQGNIWAKVKNNWKYLILIVIIIIQAIFVWRLKRKIKENGEFFDV